MSIPFFYLHVAELTQDVYPILILVLHVAELTQDVYPILALEVAELDQLLQGNCHRFVQHSPLKQNSVTKHSMLLGLKMCTQNLAQYGSKWSPVLYVGPSMMPL
jgi:hypothetical protein